jgi:cytochrome c553
MLAFPRFSHWLPILALLAPNAASADADLERGRSVAMGAATQLTPRSACFTCHGMDGAGDGSGAFPRLTGQSAWYLYKQLKDYASGARPNDVMSPIAKALTDKQMEDVSGYYAAQRAPARRTSLISDPEALQRGGAISAAGLAAKSVPACINCHGPSGRGLPPSFPYLAGQYAPYIELQLMLWKQGKRRNDPLGVMAQLARQLSPEEIRALALYFASVPIAGAERAQE